MVQRRALVTGATGFVGRNLCAHLASAGWQVTAVHRGSSNPAALAQLRADGVSTVECPDHAQLRASVRAARPDVVFHLAAHQVDASDEAGLDAYLEANVAIGAHVLEAVAGTGCVFVNAASYFQYRDGKPAAFSLYSATKQAFSELTRFYRDRRSVDVREVVLFDNFGPRDSRSKLINQLIRAAHDDLDISLGPAAQAINVLFIDDLCTGLVAAADPGNPAAMCLRSTRDTTVGDIVAELERISGRSLRKSFDESRSPHDMVENAGSWPVPRGWEPSHSLASGLRLTYDSFSAAPAAN